MEDIGSYTVAFVLQRGQYISCLELGSFILGVSIKYDNQDVLPSPIPISNFHLRISSPASPCSRKFSIFIVNYFNFLWVITYSNFL